MTDRLVVVVKHNVRRVDRWSAYTHTLMHVIPETNLTSLGLVVVELKKLCLNRVVAEAKHWQPCGAKHLTENEEDKLIQVGARKVRVCVSWRC